MGRHQHGLEPGAGPACALSTDPLHRDPGPPGSGLSGGADLRAAPAPARRSLADVAHPSRYRMGDLAEHGAAAGLLLAGLDLGRDGFAERLAEQSLAGQDSTSS